jgi:hypothetical protein
VSKEYRLEKPNDWSDAEWDELCSSLDNALERFIELLAEGYEPDGEEEE